MFFVFEKQKGRGRWPSNRKRMSKIQMLINCFLCKKQADKFEEICLGLQVCFALLCFALVVVVGFFCRTSFILSSLWDKFRLASQRYLKCGWPRWEEVTILNKSLKRLPSLLFSDWGLFLTLLLTCLSPNPCFNFPSCSSLVPQSNSK